ITGTDPHADPFGQLNKLANKAKGGKGQSRGEALRQSLSKQGYDAVVLLRTMADARLGGEPADWAIPFKPQQVITQGGERAGLTEKPAGPKEYKLDPTKQFVPKAPEPPAALPGTSKPKNAQDVADYLKSLGHDVFVHRPSGGRGV